MTLRAVSTKREPVADTVRGLEERLPALPPLELADVMSAAASLQARAAAQLAMAPLRERPRAAEPQALMTAREVADLLRISRSEVYRLAREGWLKPVAVSLSEGTLRFHRGTLDRLLESQRGA